MATQQQVIGTPSAAERNLRRSIKLCREVDEAYFEGIGHAELGRTLIYVGLFDEADKEFPNAIELFEKVNTIQYIGIVWAYRALRFLLVTRDNPKSKIANVKSAIECAQSALELADETTRTRMNIPRD